MQLKHFLFAVILSLGIINNAFPQNKTEVISDDSVRNYVYQGFSQLYNFEFKQTAKTIEFLKKNYPESPWTYVLASNYFWWKYLTGEEKKLTIGRFNYNLKKVKEKSDQVPENEGKFCLALITAFKSRIDLMEGEYLKAMKGLMQQINIVSSTLGRENEYKGYYLTSGLYHYLSAVAYRDYLILRPFLLLIPKGDLNKGIEYLKLDKKDNVLNTESEYFVLKLYFEIEKDYSSALKYGRPLINKYPQNFIFKHLYYKSYKNVFNKNLNNEQISMLENTISKNEELSKKQRQYLYHLIEKNYKNDSPQGQ